MSTSSRPRALAGVAALIWLTGCSGSKDVGVRLPVPDPAVQRACEQLADRLPQSLGKDLKRRKTDPQSPLVAAWGSPAVVLRCGVPMDPEYASGDQVFEIEAEGATAEWFAVKRGKSAVWSTPRATVHVEVVVPDEYQGSSILTPLTPAVSAARVL